MLPTQIRGSTGSKRRLRFYGVSPKVGVSRLKEPFGGLVGEEDQVRFLRPQVEPSGPSSTLESSRLRWAYFASGVDVKLHGWFLRGSFLFLCFCCFGRTA